MKHFYLLIFTLTLFTPIVLPAQNCATLIASFKTYESRCAATGAIKISASGGSGSYKYRVSGPVNINFTSVDSITGLSAGSYSIEVIDIVSGCHFTGQSINVTGNYADPRFVLNTVNVGCDNGSNGSIRVANVQNGRQPFVYSIVAPSETGVGTTSSTGIFTGLKAGNYTIRLTDSCGGIQTRTTTVENYSWSIDSHTFARTACNKGTGTLKVKDSRGNWSNTTGIPGMMYGILLSGTDTIWSSNPAFTFTIGAETSMKAMAKDACDNIKMVTISLAAPLTVDNTISISKKTCSTFQAAVTGVKNFYTPMYYLLNSSRTPLSITTSSVFPNLAYGSYIIQVLDLCTHQVVERPFTVTPPEVTISADVAVSDKVCGTFTATVTNKVNTTNPDFFLRDVNGNLLSTNKTGVFPGLAYNKYCIDIKDGCVDQTITRCIDVQKPTPKIDSLTPSYITCSVFGTVVKGDSIFNATYCLYDSLGNQVACNSTGVFDNIPLGKHCITIYDECSNTTLTRCISVMSPVLQNDMTIQQAKLCSTFTATVKTTNIVNGIFTLYDDNGNELSTNNTGIFPGLAYGSYSVKGKAVCPDTSVMVNFTAVVPKPSVSSTISITNKLCTKFDAAVTGQTNLTTPVYNLKNSAGTIIQTNTTGKFKDLLYGSYCIDVVNSCYDTTISVCTTVAAPAKTVTAVAAKSCNYGHTKITLSSSVYPFDILIYNPSNVMVYGNKIINTTVVDNLPELPAGQQYKMVPKWDCAWGDTIRITPISSYLDHVVATENICPGSQWPDGSGNLKATVTTNAGTLTVKIIKKNNVAQNISANSVTGADYNFQNLGPGTYILQYNTNDACSVYRYDTVTVSNYQFPDLNRTSAVQCDLNGFSVGAYVNNGVAPFSYEIMSSTPSGPSIVTAPQSNPVFNIDNGTEYQLIRLRAIDACGNATLGDASILPLANNKIKATTENCVGTRVRLSIDTMANSSVTWHYKKKKTDAVATYVGEGFAYQINPLTYSDTGYYFCDVVMNDGCITRSYEFNLNGVCYGVLPVVQVELSGKMKDDKSLLDWNIVNDLDLQSIVVERNNGDNFQQIGNVNVQDYVAPGNYKFTDEQPGSENQYRLKLQFKGGKVVYSKTIRLNATFKDLIRVYPNPAIDFVNVEFNVPANNVWQVELFNVASQKSVVKESITGHRYTVHRTSSMTAGMYILKVTNQKTGETYNHKVIFQKK